MTYDSIGANYYENPIGVVSVVVIFYSVFILPSLLNPIGRRITA